MLLSGGLDSSTIAYFLRKSKSITSYSLHFGSYDKEESIIAEKSAKYLGLSHQDIEMHFDLYFYFYYFSSQPQAFSSLLAWYCASLEISKFTKVVISGDGGDEVFGGYKWYTKRTLKETILNSYRSFKNPLDFEFFKLSLKSPLHRHWMLHTPRFLPSECCNLLGIKKDIFNENSVISHLKRYFQPELPLIDALRRVDLMTFCSDHICRKTDEMSMAHSLEVRAPFLDRRIVEFGLSYRSEEYKDKKSKQILRNLLASKMPREVCKMSKRGFSSNLSNYNYAQLINEIKNSKIVKDEFIEKSFENILQTSSNFKNIRLFTLASLSKWYEFHT